MLRPNGGSDLKPTNIGFDEDDHVKIFDFGLAREFSEDSPMPTTRLMTGGAGTPRYMAPEVTAMSDTYGFPADVYSFTILLWQIVTSKTPYADILSPAELAVKVVKESKRPSLSQIDFSDSLKSLVESGWSVDPTKRPTFSVICEELEKMLNQYDEGVNSGSSRRGCLKRSGSNSSDFDEGLNDSFSFLTRRRNSDDGGSPWNSSNGRTLSTSRSSRRMSM
jgi:serine/threonine protein kinase